MKIVLFSNTDWYLFNFRLSLIKALRKCGHDVLLVSPSGPYGDRLINLGFRWIEAPMQRRSLNPLRELRLVFWLWGLMRRERVDVVHGFTIKNAIYGALAARLASVPARVSAVTGMGYVFTSDDLLARTLRRPLRALFRVALAGDRARLILQNPDDVALFLAAGIVDRDHIRLIAGSGVDCERFAPALQKANATPESAHFRIVLPARLLWDKGIAEYVEASRLLRSEGRVIEFLLAGEPDPGNPASVPEAVLKQWIADGLVQHLGHVEDMPGLFNSVDAVILPSYREGLPKGLIEAGACGRPLVATDVPGCREVVTHGHNGLLVPVKDAQSLADEIRRLHDDPALCLRLGAMARETALKLFDERIVIARTMEVYQELLTPTNERASRKGYASA